MIPLVSRPQAVVGLPRSSPLCSIDPTTASGLPTLKSVQRVLSVCDRNPKPEYAARNRALVLMPVVLGLSRSTVCSLRLSDYDTKARELTVGEERVRVPDVLVDALGEWLKYRGESFYHGLFITQFGNLTKAGLHNIIYSLAGEAGERRVTHHRLRQTVINVTVGDAGIVLGETGFTTTVANVFKEAAD